MKLKDLLFNREKLRKYDELKEALEQFIGKRQMLLCMTDAQRKSSGISEYVVDVIISALEAEIAKLDEE